MSHFRRMFKFRIRNKHRNLPKAMGRTETGHGTGPAGRIERLRQLVTAVVRHERIEGNLSQLDETRGYVERLIQEALKHGDKHQATMDLADYWLLDKDLVHKLFKVLSPRYQCYTSAMTAMHRLPTAYPGKGYAQAILELEAVRLVPWVSREAGHHSRQCNHRQRVTWPTPRNGCPWTWCCPVAIDDGIWKWPAPGGHVGATSVMKRAATLGAIMCVRA